MYVAHVATCVIVREGFCDPQNLDPTQQIAEFPIFPGLRVLSPNRSAEATK
jgi:hypothetical protein